MKGLKDFLQAFFDNQGSYVFLSLLIAKICGFLGSLFVIQLLSQSQYGIITIVASVFAIFAPLSGLGSQQSLLRFGSISQSKEEKEALSNELLKSGFIYQLILSVFFFFMFLFFYKKYDHMILLFLFFAIRLIGIYFYNHIQSHFRILGENRTFAQVNNVVNLFGLFLLLIGTYFFGFMGYLIAIAIAPFISLIWFKNVSFSKIKHGFRFSKKELYDYGIKASGAALLSDLLFSVDILLLGYFMSEQAVAEYKLAILLPANITFLTVVFMQTDFPKLAQHYKDKKFLVNYIFNYYKLFIPFCVGVFLVCLFYKQPILQFFFSEKYNGNPLPFLILMLAFLLNMLSRNVYGYLLSAVGKIKINTLVAFISLPILGGFAFYLVPKYQVLGMAISMASTLLIGGVIFGFSFYFYLRNLK